MTWFRLDDGFSEHHKVAELTAVAFRLHVSAFCYCSRNLTDGVLTSKATKTLCTHSNAASKHVSELVKASLWEHRPDGYYIHDYLDYNPSKAEVLARRAAKQAAGAKGGKASGESRRGEANAQADAQAFASPVGRTTSHPIPSTSNIFKSPPVEGVYDNLWNRLLLGTRARSKTDTTKLARTIKAHRSTEREVVMAIEAATGPNVKDPLAVALAELKRLGLERKGRVA